MTRRRRRSNSEKLQEQSGNPVSPFANGANGIVPAPHTLGFNENKPQARQPELRREAPVRERSEKLRVEVAELRAEVQRLQQELDAARKKSPLKRFLRENGLSLVWLGLFFVSFLLGLTITGYREYNTEQRHHDQAEVNFSEYLLTPHLAEAATENWESEFLQLFLFVALTAFLYQKGSSESKKLDEEEPTDRDPRLSQNKEEAPWPVRKGGWILKAYEYSLSLAFLGLFLLTFILHAASGAAEYTQDRQEHGLPGQISTLEYLGTSRFWFESFQNWQSEFLAVGLMVTLSIWLRQRGSPESKPVDAPHSQTRKD